MNRFLEDKKPSISVDTNIFWKDSPRTISNGSLCQKNNLSAFCESIDDVVNFKIKDYDTENISGFVDVTSDIFNIVSIESSDIPDFNYFYNFVENN